MARIPEAEIERLKSEVSVQRLVESAGIELTRHGADWLGRCPFHDDHGPSLVVSPKKNLWHCLGACQSGGSVIDWVMRMNGVSFRHAVELLRAGVPAVAEQPVKRSSVRALPAPVAADADDRALLKQVIDYYHESLKHSPEALDYLKRRGLAHSELIDAFKLGFANRTLGLRLPEKTRKSGAEIRARLEKLGLYRASGHEHFNGSLVVPIFDEHGEVREVYGRKVNDNLRPGTPLHLYLPGPHAGVWNSAALAASKEIILCEALIDAMTFWCAGYRNVTASYGVEGFTEDHLAAFKQHGTERVLIAYDRDEAGERAAEKLAEKLLAAGLDCYRIQFPKGMDANEYALKLQPAAKALGLVIRKALWLGKGQAPQTLPGANDEPIASEPAAKACPGRLEAGEETVLPEHLLAPPAESVTNLPLVAPAEVSIESAAAAEPVLPASPLPPAPALPLEAQVNESEVVFTFGDRRYRVRGLAKNPAVDALRVNLLASRGDAFYVDTIDLYAAKHRAGYIHHAAIELQVSEEIIKQDLGRVLLKCEALQEEQIRQGLTPKPIEAVAIDAVAREAALKLLRDPALLDRILADFETIGIVGEQVNKLVGFLAATSRKLEAPLAVVIQSSSAAGKTSLMDAVLSLMPEEERIKYSAMTGQSLFYMGQANLKHKILAIVEEEGASRASYALKLLQSEGELTIASTGKDPETGQLVTQEYRVEGPVMIFLTTTSIAIDEELMNRCLVLSVDEGRSQTQAIHRRQREKRTLAGLLARAEREELLALHRNAQRLIRPLAVLNPYAQQLTFPSEATRTRRDHEKYLTLIDTIALLHQYQRPVKTTTRRGKMIEYIEVTLSDIAMANQLAHEVLGRSLDELPPQTRRVLHLIEAFVNERTRALEVLRTDFRFSRRGVREATGIGDTQLRIHLERLTELEYLLVHHGGRGHSFVYELLYDGQGKDGTPFVPGLIDSTTLQTTTTTATSRGESTPFAGPSRGHNGPNAAGSRGNQNSEAAHAEFVSSDLPAAVAKTRGSKPNGKDPSYPQPVALAAAEG
jgi:DNA primase catalytic core